MIKTANNLVAILRKELGYHEKASNYNLDDKTANSGSSNFTKYARDLAKAGYYQASKQGAEWCDMFYDWGVLQLCDGDGAKAQEMQCQTGVYGAGCPWSRGYYREKGRLFSKPEVGDQVFFQQNGNIVHTGCVSYVDDSTIKVIEGNKNNQVQECMYSRWDSYIADYGRPFFEDESEATSDKLLVSKPNSKLASLPTYDIPAKGVDVSTWQGEIDWAKAKADGVIFAMIRAGYGLGNIDQQFKRNALAAIKAGIHVGFYWFSYAYTAEMARNEADYLVDAIESLGVKAMFPLAFDYEYDSDIKAKKAGYSPNVAALGDAFLAEIEARGYYAVNYTNLDYWNRAFYKLPQFDLWWAQWGVSSPAKTCGIWQYGSDGVVNGISGRVDMDLAYKDYPAIMLRTGLNDVSDKDRAAIVVPVVAHPYGYASKTTGYVRYGKRHDGVKAIQYALQQLGYDIGSWGIDGEYGTDTRDAVKKFQADHGIEVDGIVGDDTRKKFEKEGY